MARYHQTMKEEQVGIVRLCHRVQGSVSLETSGGVGHDRVAAHRGIGDVRDAGVLTVSACARPTKATAERATTLNILAEACRGCECAD